MKPLFTFSELREAEKRIIEKDGVPSLILMENAGKNAFDIICIKYPDIEDYSIYIFCGKGNNAGDGFVVARQAAINGLDVNIINVASTNELSSDALVNFKILQTLSSRVSFISYGELSSSKTKPLHKGRILVIDAVLGSGVKGRLSEGFESAINYINSAGAANKKLQVISIDVPSGLMSGEQINHVVNADVTITMAAVKAEMLYGAGKEFSGEIFVAPIGISGDLLNRYNGSKKFIPEFDDVRKLFPKRKKASYKYSNGKVLMIGGSRGLSGAIILSALSAVKTGAGGVTAAYPKSLSTHFGRKLFDITKLELDETSEGSIASASYEAINKKISWADAVLIGPGVSLNDETKSFVFDIVKNCEKPLVVDADALTVLADDVSILQSKKSANVILTPHLGEFSKLSKLGINEILKNRFESVREFSARYNVNIIMKSESPFSCTSGGEIYVNSSGNEVLASAGSGDVLSGILVSILARLKAPKDSMICANYLHGMLSELYYEKYGNRQSAMQRDLIKFIPEAITKILN